MRVVSSGDCTQWPTLCGVHYCFSGSIRQYHSFRLLVSLFSGCVKMREQAWYRRRRLSCRTMTTDDVEDIIRCILGLPLLPAVDIPTSLQEIRATICNDMQMARQLQRLVTYVQRQWIDTGNATTSIDSSDTSDRCEVCLIQPRAAVALVPCGHSRFCVSCANKFASMDSVYTEPS